MQRLVRANDKVRLTKVSVLIMELYHTWVLMSGQMSFEPTHRNFLRAVIGFKGSAAKLKL